jgi:hypothetical protein
MSGTLQSHSQTGKGEDIMATPTQATPTQATPTQTTPVWKYELYLKESSKTPCSSGTADNYKDARASLLSAVAIRWNSGELSAYSSGRIIRPDGLVLNERLAPTWDLVEHT